MYRQYIHGYYLLLSSNCVGTFFPGYSGKLNFLQVRNFERRPHLLILNPQFIQTQEIFPVHSPRNYVAGTEELVRFADRRRQQDHVDKLVYLEGFIKIDQADIIQQHFFNEAVVQIQIFGAS